MDWWSSVWQCSLSRRRKAGSLAGRGRHSCAGGALGRPVWALWGTQLTHTHRHTRSLHSCLLHPLSQREEQRFLYNCGPSTALALALCPSLSCSAISSPPTALANRPPTVCAGKESPAEGPEKASSRGCLRGCAFSNIHAHAFARLQAPLE